MYCKRPMNISNLASNLCEPPRPANLAPEAGGFDDGSRQPVSILKTSFAFAAAARFERRSFARANARQSAAFRRRATFAAHRR
jgi:hypothetical protein